MMTLDAFDPATMEVAINAVIAGCEDVFGLPRGTVRRGLKHRPDSRSRTSAVLLLRDLREMTFPDIAQALRLRSPYSAQDGLRRARTWHEADEPWTVGNRETGYRQIADACVGQACRLHAQARRRIGRRRWGAA